MNCIALTIILILVSSSSLAEIYKWRDENGKLHFSDKPHNQAAEQVDLFVNDGFASPQTQPRTANRPHHTAPAGPKISTVTYPLEIDTRVEDKDGIVTIIGRVSGGKKCDALRIKVFAQSPSGDIVSCTGVIDGYTGFGTRRFECSDRAIYKQQSDHGEWYVTTKIPDCM